MTNEKSIKTVLVTGSSSGLGLGVAKAYLERGANVVMNGRDEAKLTAVAEELGHGDQIALVIGDVSQKEICQKMVDTAVERFGSVDVLVNNAGHFYPKPFTDYSEEELDSFLAVHLKGTYFTSQAAVKQMRKQDGGVIINITTVLAIRAEKAVPSSAPIAAKGAMNAITRSLAIELAEDNIRVNAVAPGIIKTPIHGRTDKEFEELNGMQPLGHVGEIKDIVDAVLYLADAEFVTGVILPVDGGVSAGSHKI